MAPTTTTAVTTNEMRHGTPSAPPFNPCLREGKGLSVLSTTPITTAKQSTMATTRSQQSLFVIDGSKGGHC
jgi:hypothetical protein